MTHPRPRCIASLLIGFATAALVAASPSDVAPRLPSAVTAEEGNWIRENVPLLECPDSTFQDVYYFRWAIFKRHLIPTPHGWVMSEFIQPGPGGKFGTICAPAGHHLYDGRWVRDPKYLDDYSRFWYETSDAAPNTYGEWIADAVWNRACVTGDFSLPTELLPGMIRVYSTWERTNLHASGLYWSHDLADSMEYSISGDGFRPTLNSYQYANATAIARIARRKGDLETAATFARKADSLRKLMLERLWDPEARFFKVFPFSEASGETNYDLYTRTKGKLRRLPARERAMQVTDWSFRSVDPARNAREEIGYIPWYFELPVPNPAQADAWRELVDPAGFWAPYGPTTAERRSPGFRVVPGDAIFNEAVCQWNGPSWPFATSQTLTALANFLRDYPPQHAITSADYFRLLSLYVHSHYLHSPGEPPQLWIDEDLDPDSGAWIVHEYRKLREPKRIRVGADYYHSTLDDLIISGLLGINPTSEGLLRVRPLLPAGTWPWYELRRLRIWGHDVDVTYDRDGSHLHQAPGLAVWVDGKRAAGRTDLGELDVPLEKRDTSAPP